MFSPLVVEVEPAADAVARVRHGFVAVQVDFFVFEAVAGQAYSITVTLRTLDDSTPTLYDTDGITVLGFSDDYGATTALRITWVAPRSGRYYASVAGFNRFDFGSYALTLGIWAGSVPTPRRQDPPPGRRPSGRARRSTSRPWLRRTLREPRVYRQCERA